MKKTKQRYCRNCTKPIYPKLADIKRGWGKFCSKSCKAKEQEKRTGQFAELLSGQYDFDSEALGDAMGDL